MKRTYWAPLAVMLAFASLTPSKAVAQVQTTLGAQQCVSGFLAACATLNHIDFSNSGASGAGVLSVIVTNSSDATTEPLAYLHKLIFDVTGRLPNVTGNVLAQYGFIGGHGVFNATAGDQELWNASGGTNTLTIKDNAKDDQGGNKARTLGVGESVMIQVSFDAAFAAGVGLNCADPNYCNAWTAEMRDLGADQKGKGLTTAAVPEPMTVFLLASGLVGLVGVEAVRRRREEEEEAE